MFGQSIQVDSAKGFGNIGIRLIYTESHGIDVIETGRDGVSIEEAGENGVYIDYAGADGVLVRFAEENGVSVYTAGDDGVYVFEADRWSANIEGDKNLTATPTGHIAQIYNRANQGSADVLALKVGQTSNPGSASNFITFFDGNDNGLGRIEGNGSGGVAFLSGGADFAEFLPVHSQEEVFQAGDIVGIINGKVTLNTTHAHTIKVITDRPIIVGNQQNEHSLAEMVSFIGQVPVRVSGPVSAGDWIVASGLNDGTGIAIQSSDVTLHHQIVGQAWESNQQEGLKRVNTAIGMDHRAANGNLIRNLQQNVQHLEDQIEELKQLVVDNR